MRIETFGIGNFRVLTLQDGDPDEPPLEAYEHINRVFGDAKKGSLIIELNTNGYYVMPSQEKSLKPYSDPANRFDSVKDSVTAMLRDTHRRGVSLIAIVLDHEVDHLDIRLGGLYYPAFGGVSPCKSPAYKA